MPTDQHKQYDHDDVNPVQKVDHVVLPALEADPVAEVEVAPSHAVGVVLDPDLLVQGVALPSVPEAASPAAS
jgi:hypothetical protein